MVKCAVNTMETILCGLKLLTQFVSSVGSNELEQMRATHRRTLEPLSHGH